MSSSQFSMNESRRAFAPQSSAFFATVSSSKPMVPTVFAIGAYPSAS